MNSDLRLVGRTLLLARVDCLGRQCRSNLSMPFLVHAGPSNTPPQRGSCFDAMLNHHTHFLSQNPGLRLKGRGLSARVDRMGQRRGTNLSMPFCVHAEPPDTYSAAVLALCTDKDLETEESLWSLYERWQRFHNVSLDLNEKQRRFKAFKDNARYIHQFNKSNDNECDDPCKLGLNHFADLTLDEFISKYTGLRKRDPYSPAPSSTKD